MACSSLVEEQSLMLRAWRQKEFLLVAQEETESQSMKLMQSKDSVMVGQTYLRGHLPESRNRPFLRRPLINSKKIN